MESTQSPKTFLGKVTYYLVVNQRDLVRKTTKKTGKPAGHYLHVIELAIYTPYLLFYLYMNMENMNRMFKNEGYVEQISPMNPFKCIFPLTIFSCRIGPVGLNLLSSETQYFSPPVGGTAAPPLFMAGLCGSQRTDPNI